jgi:hypothetical protein
MNAEAEKASIAKTRRCITCESDYAADSAEIHTALKLFEDCCICVACVDSYRKAGGPLASTSIAEPHAGKDSW